jgi:hypothetical protein
MYSARDEVSLLMKCGNTTATASSVFCWRKRRGETTDDKPREREKKDGVKYVSFITQQWLYSPYKDLGRVTRAVS